jgi:hypothetical protein
MKALAKVGLVVAGYVAAFVVALALVSAYVASTSGPDRQTYAGMYDFGDSLLLLALFGVAAILPTGAALYFLRPNARFWRALTFGAPAIAATGLGALIDYIVARMPEAGPLLQSWSAFAVLRILVAPMLAVAFLLACLFAPSRSARIALAAATLVEAVVFTGFLLPILHAPR